MKVLVMTAHPKVTTSPQDFDGCFRVEERPLPVRFTPYHVPSSFSSSHFLVLSNRFLELVKCLSRSNNHRSIRRTCPRCKEPTILRKKLRSRAPLDMRPVELLLPMVSHRIRYFHSNSKFKFKFKIQIQIQNSNSNSN